MSRDPPIAMIDPISGNLLTSEEKIQEAAVSAYTKRLENRPMKDNLNHIRDAKEALCEKLKLKQASSSSKQNATLGNETPGEGIKVFEEGQI